MEMLTQALERLFRERATPQVVRAIEDGRDDEALWSEITESGFLDLLLPEENGGAGVSLSEAFPSFLLAGLHAVPLPFVQTVLARAWLQAHGVEAPEGRIAIAGPETQQSADGGLVARGVAFGKVADWVLAQFDALWALLPADSARVEGEQVRGSLSADFHWASLPGAALIVSYTEGNVSPVALGAAALAPLMAGAARQALDMTLTHVAERQQFGRPIAQFQAVQSQVSVMAERVWAMRMAARLAFHASGVMPSPVRTALAKARCSEAAVQVADIAHALHGAIGITEEYDLQLYTRRLREWRRTSGSEAWWARELGSALLASQGSVLDFIIANTQAPA